MVHDDGPLGLDGLKVEFDDERAVSDAGAEGEKLLRADSGFWSAKAFERLEKAGWRFSIGVRMQKGSARR